MFITEGANVLKGFIKLHGIQRIALVMKTCRRFGMRNTMNWLRMKH